MAQGRGAALVLAAGASVGLVVHPVFAATGLSALLARSAVAYSVVKYVGAAYLVYPGARSLLDRRRFALPRGEAPVGPRKVFSGRGLQRAEPQDRRVLSRVPVVVRGPRVRRHGPRLPAFGLIFALLILAIFGALALFSGTVGLWVGTWPRFAGGLEWLTGGVLIPLGLRLVL